MVAALLAGLALLHGLQCTDGVSPALLSPPPSHAVDSTGLVAMQAGSGGLRETVRAGVADQHRDHHDRGLMAGACLTLITAVFGTTLALSLSTRGYLAARLAGANSALLPGIRHDPAVRLMRLGVLRT